MLQTAKITHKIRIYQAAQTYVLASDGTFKYDPARSQSLSALVESELAKENLIPVRVESPSFKNMVATATAITMIVAVSVIAVPDGSFSAPPSEQEHAPEKEIPPAVAAVIDENLRGFVNGGLQARVRSVN